MAAPYAIQEFRCRLTPGVLTGERIAYLDFPYQQAIQNWIEQITTLLTMQGKKWQESDNPPYRALNKLLVALTPSLIHPFERYFIRTVNDNEALFMRKMLTFEQAFRPSLKQLEPVIRVWLRHWIEDRFADEIKTPLGSKAYADLLQELSHPTTQWQSIQADQLLGDIQNRLLYRAIPSLLAVRLVGKDSEIRGRHVTWQLTQEAGSNRLALVSQPLHSIFPDPYNPGQQVEGYFAYHVEFGAQTVPGDPTPFIDVSISCRRY